MSAHDNLSPQQFHPETFEGYDNSEYGFGHASRRPQQNTGKSLFETDPNFEGQSFAQEHIDGDEHLGDMRVGTYRPESVYNFVPNPSVASHRARVN
jgi:hypothetical protein